MGHHRHHHHHHPSSPLCHSVKAGRGRVLSALSVLAMSGESLSLSLVLIPRSRQCFATTTLALQHQSTAEEPHQMHCQYKRRRIRTSELNLLQLYSENSACYRVDRRFSGGSSGRMSTSLSMDHYSDVAGDGFGNDNDKSKKRKEGSSSDSSGGSPKQPKAGKSIEKDDSVSRSPSGAFKGASISSFKNSGGRHKSSSKNSIAGVNSTQLKNDKQSRKQQTNKNTKTNVKLNDTSKIDTGKGRIKSSDENTSLKGFKSEKQQPSRTRTNQGRVGSPTPTSNENKGNDVSNIDLLLRVAQLETIVSNQMTEIQKLRREVDIWTKGAVLFSKVVDVLRKAGIQIDGDDDGVIIDDENEVEVNTLPKIKPVQQQLINDDLEIFGIAPKSVTDAADTAGASMLSAILAGKHRMLVDVRDAELTRDPKLLVEFIELAILPVAAGLEGLDYVRNRVKILFPTVKELMSYRKSMALAAPEVVALSTLGFEPVNERDNLIVVIAPSPDDMAGVAAMEKLLARTDKNYVEPHRRILQPVVVMNHHMVPVNMAGFGQFTTVYHLRLLSVQYMSGDAAPDFVKEKPSVKSNGGDESIDDTNVSEAVAEKGIPGIAWNQTKEEEEALEAAMTHAHEIGFHQGVTRAMVIRAYPKPWHVFVDTSPDTDADFEVAATFDVEPTQEDVNYAIVECLEGSEREDEIVAQQMQAALEAGQLNRVSEMLGISPSDMVSERKSDIDTDTYKPFQEYDGKDWDDLYYDDWFSEDSV